MQHDIKSLTWRFRLNKFTCISRKPSVGMFPFLFHYTLEVQTTTQLTSLCYRCTNNNSMRLKWGKLSFTRSVKKMKYWQKIMPWNFKCHESLFSGMPLQIAVKEENAKDLLLAFIIPERYIPEKLSSHTDRYIHHTVCKGESYQQTFH